MKILYLTQTFPPEPGATLRPLDQARWLSRRGHDVQVITAFPSYPSGRLEPADRGVAWRRERMQGIPVTRVWTFPASTGVGLRRLVSFASFAGTSAVAGLAGSRPDVVIASVPHPLTELAGCLIAKGRGARYVVELRDLLPETLVTAGMSRDTMTYRLARRYFRTIYRHCDAIVTPYPAMGNYLVEHCGVPEDRILTIPHGVDLDRVASASRDAIRRGLGIERSFVAMYAGSFARYYAVPDLVREFAGADAGMHLVLLGAGHDAPEIRQLAGRLGPKAVTVVDGVPPDVVPDYLAGADVFLAPRRLGAAPPIPSLNTKVCEYLAHGRPIIAIEDAPCVGPLLEETGAGRGVVFGCGALRQTLRDLATQPRLRDQMGRRARAYAAQHLSREHTMRRFGAWLEQTA